MLACSHSYSNSFIYPKMEAIKNKCGLQMSSVLLSEGKHTIKRQLYSGPFTSRGAASFIFWHSLIEKN